MEIVMKDFTFQQQWALTLRGFYKRLFHPQQINSTPLCIKDKEAIQMLLYNRIKMASPLMVARMGSIELDMCENLRYTFYEKRGNSKFIRWKGQPNFLNPYLIPIFGKNAGFFPLDDNGALKQFYLLMIECMTMTDILGSWRVNEAIFATELKNAIKVDRERMTPLLTKFPWTKALEGKKVLVVHPFADTITRQYQRREQIFPNDPDILPEFDLKVVRAVQSAAGEQTKFRNWFEALKYMEDEIDIIDYDIALLGCGAYGFPLAAHCKKMGKQAVHLGGSLQLLFGIIGSRWENDMGYIKNHPYLPTYRNEYWVRPSEEETPKSSNEVEGNCYW